LGFLLGKLDLLIGNDTGITHFAGKAGIRTICIKAGTSPPREWGPIGENASWIYRDEPCAPCGLHDIAKCKNRLACTPDILPVDQARPDLSFAFIRGTSAQPEPRNPRDVCTTQRGWVRDGRAVLRGLPRPAFE